MPEPRAFLVDDHALVRAGMRALLERGGVTVVGEAASAEEALAAIDDQQLDVLLADISLEGASGLELIKGLAARWPDLPVLVVSMHDEQLYAERAVQAGARGYLMKDAAPAHLLEAIETVVSQRVYLSPEMTARALERMRGGCAPESSPVESLSDRELEVYTRMGQGMSTREIAEALHLSVKTVESHRANLKRKLGVGSAAELMRMAVLHVTGA